MAAWEEAPCPRWPLINLLSLESGAALSVCCVFYDARSSRSATPSTEQWRGECPSNGGRQ